MPWTTRIAGFQLAEQQQRHAAMGGQRRGMQRRLGEDAERPFAADQQSRQVEIISRQDAPQGVPRTVADQRRLAFADQHLIVAQQAGQPRDDAAFGLDRFSRLHQGRVEVGKELRQRFALGLEPVAARQDDLDAADIVPHRPDPHGMRPGGVDTQHPADRGHGGRGRIGRQVAPDLAELLVERVADDARLDPDRVVGDLLDGGEVPREVDDDPFTESPAGDIRFPLPARDQRDRVLGTILR